MLLQVNVRAPEGKRHRSPGRTTYPELERLVRARGDWPGLPSKAALLAPCAWGAGYEYKTPFKVLVDENYQPVAYDDPALARAGGLATAEAGWALGSDHDAHAKTRGETTMAKEGKTADGKSVAAKKTGKEGAKAGHENAGHCSFEPLANNKEMLRFIVAVEQAGKLFPNCATPNGTGGKPKGSFSMLRWTRVVGELKLVNKCWMEPVGGNTRDNKLFHNLRYKHTALAAFVITECEKRAAAAGHPFASRTR